MYLLKFEIREWRHFCWFRVFFWWSSDGEIEFFHVDLLPLCISRCKKEGVFCFVLFCLPVGYCQLWYMSGANSCGASFLVNGSQLKEGVFEDTIANGGFLMPWLLIWEDVPALSWVTLTAVWGMFWRSILEAAASGFSIILQIPFCIWPFLFKIPRILSVNINVPQLTLNYRWLKFWQLWFYVFSQMCVYMYAHLCIIVHDCIFI